MEIDINKESASLSKYVANLSESGEILILDSGKPVAKLISLDSHTQDRVPGLDKGLIEMSDDFDDPLPPDIAAGFGL